MVKLASWNINSLKVRLPQVLAWFETAQVDILALQETKVTDDNFPLEAFTERGWHVVFSGQKTYNGVAIISRTPITDIMTDLPSFVDPQRRILAATIADIRLINLYVPNGAAVSSDKYAYKLTWLTHIKQFIEQQLAQFTKVAVVGDFNIAPADCDVHDPLDWQGCVLVSPAERQAFTDLCALGLHDSFRELNPNIQAFSWWDYRAAAFRRNRGLRIDHVLLSDALYARCKVCEIDKEPRKAIQPSDHAPVWVALRA